MISSVGGGGASYREKPAGIVGGGRLPILMRVIDWPTRKSHDVTRASQACEVLLEPVPKLTAPAPLLTNCFSSFYLCEIIVFYYFFSYSFTT